MQRYIKEQILEMLVTVNEGLSFVENAKKAEIQTKQQVLIDCAACMKTIQEFVETSGDKSAYFNAFHDSLQSIAVVLPQKSSAGKFFFVAKKAVLKIQEQIQQISVNREIVFLPYKASMWDSLESVWRAAQEDPHCDAYVVPIPYFDRGNDGQVIQMHCEADQFPSYVPITDYREYNLSQRKPDVIYIHNPYDDHNYVTTVHPDYYSSELKKYTDLLVYVPYFIVGEEIAEHFCKSPGIINADKVIVQSEKIKTQYEKFYPGGNPPKGKFLALGSPKFDKVLSSKREDFVLPLAWKKRIEGKKVILYNTHLDGLMNQPDKVLKKLQYVFSVFQGRNDVVLWWRPHPLSVATSQAMRPDILEQYKALENAYKDNDIGIFDDTADLHRAISWSDAYYGDMSSLVWMYELTGKPILLQNMKMEEKREVGISLFFGKIAVDGSCIWGAAAQYPVLCKYNLKSGKIEFMEKIPGESWLSYNAKYVSLVKVNHKIIIMPAYGDKFIWYDTLDEKFGEVALKPIDVGDCLAKYDREIKFSDAIVYGECVFFIGCGYPAIVCYNAGTNECIYHSKWFDEMAPFLRYEDRGIFARACRSDIDRNIMLITCLQTNIILEFNMKTKESRVHTIGKVKNGLYAICYDGRDYWITSYYDCNIKRWNFESNSCKEYNQFPQGFNLIRERSTPFCTILYNEGKIFAFPNCSNMIVAFDSKDDKIEGKEVVGRCGYATFFGEKIFIATSSEKDVNCIRMFDSRNFSSESKIVPLTRSLKLELMKEVLIAQSAAYEDLFTLEDLLDDKSLLTLENKLLNKMNMQSGNRIHTMLSRIWRAL